MCVGTDRGIQADEEEKAHRKANLIFQGLEESGAQDPNEKYNDDVCNVKEIVKDLGITENIEIKSMFRLNFPKSYVSNHTNRRPRLLKVVLQSEEQKNKILDKHRQKQKETEPGNSGMLILPDRNFKERQAYAKLAKDRNEKNMKLQDDNIKGKKWVISRGRLRLIPVGGQNMMHRSQEGRPRSLDSRESRQQPENPVSEQ
ncbi:hypothetical protein Pmani_022835 [Petrolisthes manimaculis]|uniref:Uncharacterized protein n=1 Tax=Petrolisthes manimaculis TaxID=1843537 RepID=A0AAE1PDA0_9EUCA|nr:hypothetical protein Pmani_022835 [Petrolisthes manimaculis]